MTGQLPLFPVVTFPEHPCEWEKCGDPSEFYVQRFPKRGPVTAHLMLCAHCLPIVEARDKQMVRERVLTLSPFADAIRRDGKWMTA